jgi:hypothetical protein
MARKKKHTTAQAQTAKKRARRCSLCRTPGHTKRTCRTRGGITQTTSIQERKPLVVRVTKNMPTSSHVVNLKNNQSDDLVEDIPVFTEQKKPVVTRVTVPFAQLVRRANGLAQAAKSGRPAFKKIIVPKKKKETPRIPKLQTQRLTFAIQRKERPVRSRSRRSIPAWLEPHRFVAIVTALCLIAFVPFPVASYYKSLQQTVQTVAQQTTDGFLLLQSSTVAALHANVPQAQHDLASALKSFALAGSLVEKEHQLLQSLVNMIPVVGSQLQSRQSLLAAGHHVALANSYVIKGVGTVQHSTDMTLTDKVEVLGYHIRSALPQYEQALERMASISIQTIPAEHQKTFEEFRVLFATFIDDLRDMHSLMNVSVDFFGGDDFKRYLIVFQNERELRATGGFIGSFAVCDFQKGTLLGCDIPSGGSYDLQGSLSAYVQPPSPLQIVNSRWEFQDANWWPDFEASAKKMMWFYEKSEDTTVDGVIAINAAMFESFLSVVGPVYSDSFSLAFDADTGLDTLQTQVEESPNTEKPKEIIGSLAEQFAHVLPELESTDMMKLVVALHHGLSSKDVQIYTEDEQIQTTLASFGWTGAVLPTSQTQDYLYVVGSNVGGAKSNKRIVQDIDHQAVVDADGNVTVTTVIHRLHTGRIDEGLYGSTNIDYLRVYVPEGSVLRDAGGFTFPPEQQFHAPEPWYDIDADVAAYDQQELVHDASGTRINQQFGKTVFGNWVMTHPGQESNVFFVYDLPFKIPMDGVSPSTKVDAFHQRLADFRDHNPASRYSLLVQKQSGIDSVFRSTIIYPDGWRPAWRSSGDVQFASNGSRVDVMLDHDRLFGMVFEKQQ